jgi:hypothetical protein
MSVEFVGAAAEEEAAAGAADDVAGSVEAAATAETADEPESEAEPVARAAPAARLVELASAGATAAADETSAEGATTTTLDADALGAVPLLSEPPQPAPPPAESNELFHDPFPPPLDHFSEASKLTRVELVSSLVEFLCLFLQREQDELVGLPRAEGARAMRGRRAKRYFMMSRESGPSGSRVVRVDWLLQRWVGSRFVKERLDRQSTVTGESVA